MEALDRFFDLFGWLFELSAMGWFYLFLGAIGARIVYVVLWQLLFPDSYKAHKQKRRLARAENDRES